jgi:hypothetical protein
MENASKAVRSLMAVFAGTALTVLACSASQKPATPGRRVASELRLYVFDCGTLKAGLARFRLKKGRSRYERFICTLLPDRSSEREIDMGPRCRS